MHRPSSILFAAFLLGACGGGTKTTAPVQPAAHAEAVAHETELLRLTLSPAAEQRLGIEVVRVGAGSAEATRETAGEIVAPAWSGGVPATSATNLATLATQQVAADGEVARASAQARLARIALTRADSLVREEAGSVRGRDEAAAALATANAAAEAARQQRRLLGPSVGTLDRQPQLWVRVMVAAADLPATERNRAVEVRGLGQNGAPRTARPIAAPPSANPQMGTVDLYYAIDNRDRAFRVGQRVAVTLPLVGGTKQGLAVPTAAIVRDIYGGEWVYQRTEPTHYVRRRVEVASSQGGTALIRRGLTRGDEVVTAGVAELFGTEFGVAH